MRKDLLAVGVGSASIAIVVTALVILSLAPTLNLFGYVGVDLETTSVHMRIQIWKGNELILDEYHAGAVTDLGDNTTIVKLFGDTTNYNGSQYSLNATFISIGNQGTLDTTSTVLPGEWNRTSGTLEDQVQSQLNITATFYPDAGGPYTADCIGLNLESGIGNDGNLWGYDTFTEVTGIDNTFTINVEFQVSVSHT